MSYLCQIFTAITLDILDKMVYTLDTHAPNIEQ
jgi:hypothetical protein